MTTKAVVWVKEGLAAVRDVSLPQLREGYLLVKVTAVAINPTDWKKVDNPKLREGIRLGCDFAGVVEEVGDKVDKPFKKGDRITGMIRGGDLIQSDNGAFATYAAAKAAVQIKTPDNLSDTDAATLGVSMFTVGQGLYRTLGLPLPTGDVPANAGDRSILIHGGSTATGIYGIQFAKLSGYRVIVTASPHNFDYLKSLGADAAFDYKSPTVASDIRAYTNDSLQLGWDCIGTGAAIIAGAISSQGGKYATIIPVDKEAVAAVNPKVDGPHATLAYHIFGEPHIWPSTGQEYPADAEELEFASKFAEITRGLLAARKLRAPRTIVNSGGSGLEGVIKGLAELKSGGISAGKLVYTL